MTLPERITSKFYVTEECWLWNRPTRDGYGIIWFDGRDRRAHRVIYEALVGPIPEGLEIDHLCRVRHCVNPDHLEIVTHAENVRRGEGGSVNRNKTRCPAGHPYDEANTRRRPDGVRVCRACRRVKDAAYYQRRKAEGFR